MPDNEIPLLDFPEPEDTFLKSVKEIQQDMWEGFNAFTVTEQRPEPKIDLDKLLTTLRRLDIGIGAELTRNVEHFIRSHIEPDFSLFKGDIVIMPPTIYDYLAKRGRLDRQIQRGWDDTVFHVAKPRKAGLGMSGSAGELLGPRRREKPRS